MEKFSPQKKDDLGIIVMGKDARNKNLWDEVENKVLASKSQRKKK